MNKDKEYLKIYDGKNINDFEHIEEYSWYNHNYYKGYEDDIILQKSDDCFLTHEYFFVDGFGKLSNSILIGESNDDGIIKWVKEDCLT